MAYERLQFVVAWRIATGLPFYFSGYVKSRSAVDEISDTASTKHVLLDDFFIFTPFLFEGHKTPKLYNTSTKPEFLHDTFALIDP